MTDVQRVASVQAAAMMTAIQQLGGRATAAEISGETGFTLGLVRQRLARNGPSELLVSHRYFTRKGESWGLTERGRAVAGGPAA